ncbi:MAG: gamma-glutamyltransferase [Flavobacteriaceae bacterium]|nr:gamma-glutamyltransferase [Flavobacteriaceae bacterium]|tara:strand:+ start:10589 stop:12259 length:1671 start_codon:yes stop_codon:yes gene_type:complete
MKKTLFLSLVLVFISCIKEVKTPKAAVVSARIEASKIGVEILKKGGNAFDAMIATNFALAVCFPNAGNISGGGFMVYRKKNGETGSIDYREMAPIKAFEKMYQNELGEVIPDKSTKGGLAVGVPGTVAGLFEIHRRFGTIPMKDLIKPSIDLALNGFIVTAGQKSSLDAKRADFIEVNGQNTFYGNEFKKGDTIKNIAFAKALKLISEKGEEVFYKGEIAESIVEEVIDSGGIIDLEDLAAYEPKWRKPINFKYKNLNIFSMSPPSSGGICLAQMLKMIEKYPIKDFGYNSEKTIQLMIEAERRSYADRSKFLGDPDFIDIPIDTLIDEKYLLNRMKDFTFSKATSSSKVNPGEIVSWNESEETTHFSIIDQFGNAVSITTTLNASYGSKVYVEKFGFFLNNEMDDFSSKPGTQNMFGLIGGKANSIEPRKRMLSSMTPTIIEKDGSVYMILGTPGGSTIITSVFQVILNAYEFGMNIQEAVNFPRFHHQWIPEKVEFEKERFENKIIENLQIKGYDIKSDYIREIGRVDAIMISDEGIISAGADPRGDDAAAFIY